jgi:hypothetical protein
MAETDIWNDSDPIPAEAAADKQKELDHLLAKQVCAVSVIVLLFFVVCARERLCVWLIWLLCSQGAGLCVKVVQTRT